jgi:hypothetical protein
MSLTVVNKHTHTPTENDIYVGRGSILGNPYTSIHGQSTKAEFICETREESIKCFSSHLKEKIQKKDKEICDELNRIWKIAKSGKSVNLVCFCSPKACHATVIKRTLEQTLRIHKTYNGQLNKLQQNQIFVFGANTEGRHGKGAALTAKNKHGAIYWQARGRQGQSYAIITKDLTRSEHPSRTREQIIEEICGLYEYATANPELEFMIPYNAETQNLNFFSAQEMADMFGSMPIPKNIVFEYGFYSLIHITFP